MLLSIEVGLGEKLNDFYNELSPHQFMSPSFTEFAERGFSASFAFAPSRMVDKAQEMLDAWNKNKTGEKAKAVTSGNTVLPKLPVVLVAIAKDYTPQDGSTGLQVYDKLDVFLPTDERQRLFKVQFIEGDVRAQIVICSHERDTAMGIASQLLLFLSHPDNRGFNAKYRFAQCDNSHPVWIELPNSSAINVDVGSDNLTMLAIDLTLKCRLPIYHAPKEGEPNDGKGTNYTDDPSGYPLVASVSVNGVDQSKAKGTAQNQGGGDGQ
jgi:hypothetical protein